MIGTVKTCERTQFRLGGEQLFLLAFDDVQVGRAHAQRREQHLPANGFFHADEVLVDVLTACQRRIH